MLGWIRRQIDVRAGRDVVDEPLERVAGQPAAFLVDVERHRLEALRIHGGDDRLGGKDGDLVLGRPPAEEDPDPQPVHAGDARPMTRISGSSSMPNRSWTRSRISAIKASTSSALAPPRLTMKFACLGETCAPPICSPLRPQASISRPAESPGGFLKVLPRLRCSIGWVARRCFCTSSSRARTVAAGSLVVAKVADVITHRSRDRLKTESR